VLRSTRECVWVVTQCDQNGDNFILSYTKFRDNPFTNSRVVDCVGTDKARILPALVDCVGTDKARVLPALVDCVGTDKARILPALDSNAPSNLSKIG
jgi:hypothetical protein